MFDQTMKTDAGKPKLSLVPTEIIEDIARVREYGNNKYPTGGKDNWKQVEPDRYKDAAYRHLLAYLNDEKSVDEESGIPHLWHLACNIAFLCHFDKGGDKIEFKPHRPIPPECTTTTKIIKEEVKDFSEDEIYEMLDQKVEVDPQELKEFLENKNRKARKELNS